MNFSFWSLVFSQILLSNLPASWIFRTSLYYCINSCINSAKMPMHKITKWDKCRKYLKSYQAQLKQPRQRINIKPTNMTISDESKTFKVYPRESEKPQKIKRKNKTVSLCIAGSDSKFCFVIVNILKFI